MKDAKRFLAAFLMVNLMFGVGALMGFLLRCNDPSRVGLISALVLVMYEALDKERKS